jgi:hypothetical protein
MWPSKAKKLSPDCDDRGGDKDPTSAMFTCAEDFSTEASPVFDESSQVVTILNTRPKSRTSDVSLGDVKVLHCPFFQERLITWMVAPASQAAAGCIHTASEGKLADFSGSYTFSLENGHHWAEGCQAGPAIEKLDVRLLGHDWRTLTSGTIPSISQIGIFAGQCHQH